MQQLVAGEKALDESQPPLDKVCETCVKRKSHFIPVARRNQGKSKVYTPHLLCSAILAFTCLMKVFVFLALPWLRLRLAARALSAGADATLVALTGSAAAHLGFLSHA